MATRQRQPKLAQQATATVGAGGVLKRILLGRPLASEEAGHQLLRKFVALPVFASDALSSNAYATEEIMLVLVLAGTGSLRHVMPIALAIAALLLIVVTSYRQTVKAYPQGGGSYIVSRENIGEIPGLVAASALLVDYVLTVSVSVVAGTAAIVSAAPSLLSQRVPLSLGFIALITLINLRGAKESGTLFAAPTYLFIVLIFTTIILGVGRCMGGCPTAATADLPIEAHQALGVFVLLRAFSSGATALTGVEAIADGVQAFRRPKAKNAAATLGVMGAVSVSMFLGISFLATRLRVHPITEEMVEHGVAAKTVVAQIAETVYGGGLMFVLIQIATALILVLAANTAYQDFPRLSSILARDRYMPRQFRNRGDRLVFSNGVIVLAVLAALLVIAFDAEVSRLIQLYVVGVFTSFTLSQTGMVKRFLKLKEVNWRRRAIISGIGATVTGMVLVVVTITKFTHGAYIVVIAVPLLVLGLKAVNRHYVSVGTQLRVPEQRPDPATGTSVVLLAPDLSSATLRAIGYALALRPTAAKAIFVGRDDGTLRADWRTLGIRIPLEVIPQQGDLADTVRAYVRSQQVPEGTFLTVVIPETLEERGWKEMLRTRRLLLLKASLLFEPRVVVTDVPQVKARIAGVGETRRPQAPSMNIAVVLVSAIHNASLRAIAYAEAINPFEVRAVCLAVDAEETEGIMSGWADAGLEVPLDILESPFREVSRPVIRFIKGLREHHPDATITVVIPEFIVRKWWHHFLHNQSALRIKAALLFEPGVVVTSVPYHLG